MDYIESNLLPNEEFVYRANLHWIIFLKSCAVIALGVLLLTVEPRIGGIGVEIYTR